MKDSCFNSLLSVGAAGGIFALFWCQSFTVSLLFGSILGLAWLSKWCRGEEYTSPVRIDGKLAVVTGANRGIGYETAKGLAARGGRVILACRNVKKAEDAKRQIEQELGIDNKQQITVMEIDLSSFKSVRKFAQNLAKKEAKIDILIHNAGFAFEPKNMTEDGHEQVFQVNYLSAFLLTHLLLNLLKNAGNDARVVFLSSLMHKYDKRGIQFEDLKWEKTKFDSWKAYSQSKLASLYLARKMTNELAGTGVTAYAVHPGVVATDFGVVYEKMIPSFMKPVTDQSRLFMKTNSTGAATSLYCALEPDLNIKSVGGSRYYADCDECEPHKLGYDTAACEKLWQVSLELLGGQAQVQPLTPKGGSSLASSPVVEASPPLPPVMVPDTTTTHTLSGGSSDSEPADEDMASDEVEVSQEEELDMSSVQQHQIVEEVGEINDDLLGDSVEPDSSVDLLGDSVQPESSGDLLGDSVQPESSGDLLGDSVEPESSGDLLGDLTGSSSPAPVAPVDLPTPDEAKASLLADIQSFQPTESLSPVKSASKEPLSGTDLLKHDILVRDVEQFDKESALKHVEETVEKSWLPDTTDIQEEKTRIEHLTGIEEFGSKESPLKPVKTKEPLSGVELLQHELVTKDVEEFDREGGLKHVEVEEKTWIPDPETIKDEKARQEHLAGIESFGSGAGDQLKAVKTPEPLSGVELLQHELVAKGVEQFDKETGLKHVDEVVEKNWLPDQDTIKEEKTRIKHLTGIEEFGSKESPLKPVKTKEPLSGLELLQHELVTKGVEEFDREGGLKHVEVEEKTWIPDPDSIQEEKTRMEHLSSIEQFGSSEGSLRPVKTQEPLSGAELLKMELTQKAVADELVNFDKNSQLQHAEVEVKQHLPEPQDIQEEKSRNEFLKSVEEFSSDNLSPVSTKEPLSGNDLFQQEVLHQGILDEVRKVDTDQLKTTTTLEKVVLPGSEDINREKAHQEHLKDIESFDASQLKPQVEEVDPLLTATTTSSNVEVDLLGTIEDIPASPAAAREDSPPIEQPIVKGAELLRQELLEVRDSRKDGSNDDEDERERRSSSEEWEKISAGEVEQQSTATNNQPTSSDC